jgi:ubiquinone/menaquinone biosynthesis C-methylase UbiE
MKKNFFNIFLRKIKRLLDSIFGDLVDEVFWKFIHLFKYRWSTIFLETRSSPHRQHLINLILKNKKIKKILELGCGDGVNLRIISKKNKLLELHGVDINRYNVMSGFQSNRKLNLNINFYQANIKKLKMFEDNKFDIVFTDAALMYISNNNIKQTIEEAIRVSRKKRYFFEMNTSGKSFYHDKWIHNYTYLLNKISNISTFEIHEVSDGREGDWYKFGKIIEIIKQ